MQDTATCSTPKPRTGIEGLDVYSVAIEFYRLLRQSTRGRRGHTIDRSYRAAESVVLNIAETYPITGFTGIDVKRQPTSVSGRGSVSDQRRAACVGGSRERARGPRHAESSRPRPTVDCLPRTHTNTFAPTLTQPATRRGAGVFPGRSI